MAELTSEYLAERLNSRELLALLFVCEARRKKTLDRLTFQGGQKPAAWTEFIERFAARLHKLPETERAYLIGSHLQSAEELDIYSNRIVQELLDHHRDLLQVLVKDLDLDPRFVSA
jgi:hypothetical protein